MSKTRSATRRNLQSVNTSSRAARQPSLHTPRAARVAGRHWLAQSRHGDDVEAYRAQIQEANREGRQHDPHSRRVSCNSNVTGPGICARSVSILTELHSELEAVSLPDTARGPERTLASDSSTGAVAAQQSAPRIVLQGVSIID